MMSNLGRAEISFVIIQEDVPFVKQKNNYFSLFFLTRITAEKLLPIEVNFVIISVLWEKEFTFMSAVKTY